MASNLRVDQILPSTSTNVAIGTATGSVTLVGSVSGTSITNSGVTTVAAGSASAPSITPTGDSNTGIFFPSADTIAFAEGGVEALRIDSSSNIGIGTNNPGAKLEVFGDPTCTLYIRGGGPGSDVSRRATLGLYASGNKIYNLRADASDGSFQVLDSSTERLRIDSSGNVGIGTDNPGAGIKLHVVGGEIKAGRVDASQEGGQVSFGRATDNATGWYIDVYGNTSTPSLRFVDVSNASVRATIDGSGRLTLPSQPSFMVHGATFNSTTPDIYLGSVVDHNVGNHFSTTTGLFTAPISGKYFFSFSFSTEDTNSHFVNLVKNGSTYPNNMLNYGVVYQPGTNTQIMNLSAGDTVSARRRASGYAVYYAWFCGYLLG
jgi:hypothetical protein